MALNINDLKLYNNTPVKDFPDKYEELLIALDSEITRLENMILAKDRQIDALKSALIATNTNLKSEFSVWFNEKMDEFENKFQKKQN